MASDDYAVVIGINRYPGISNLNGPENDARAFKAWLINQDGGNIPDDSTHLQLILSSHFPQTDNVDEALPTIIEINRALVALIRAGEAQGGQLGRRLYLFMAGHGFAPDLDETALKVANADFFNPYHIPGHLYAKWFRSAAYFKEVVLIMDCCRDDYRRVPVYPPPWPRKFVQGARVRHFYAFATEWSKKARERRMESHGEVRGVFTNALVAALESAPPNKAGEVTGKAVADYVFNYLPTFFEGQEYQEPEFDYRENRDIVFTHRHLEDGATNVIVNFERERPGKYSQILDGALEPVGENREMVGRLKLTLQPGMYQIRMTENGRSKNFEVFGQEVTHVTF